MNEFFKDIEKRTEDINLITEHLLVARSRSVIRYRQKVLKQDILLPTGKKIEFPDRSLDSIKYQVIKDEKILENFSQKVFKEEYQEVKKNIR